MEGFKDFFRSREFKSFKRNKLALFGVVVLSIFIMLSVFAPVLASHDRDEIDITKIEEAPDSEHILGTDEVGRDVYSRLLYGGRVSIGVGIAATGLQLLIGVTLGAIAGFFGGFIDNLIMRFVDVIMCFPFFVIAISLAALIGPSVWNVILIIGILQWTNIARIVRAEFISLKRREFIEGARALGLNSREIIVKHLMPNVMPQIIVFATLGIANGVLMEAALSFLGMGVKQPQPSWGNMLSAAQSIRVLQSEWWLFIPAGACVFLTVLSINFLGDGIRDALDPKSK